MPLHTRMLSHTVIYRYVLYAAARWTPRATAAHTRTASTRPPTHPTLAPTQAVRGEREEPPPRVKLLDFGVAQLCEVTTTVDGTTVADDSIQKSGGTPAFYAPEMCLKGEYRGRPADIWACGVTLCMLVGGRLPFDADNIPALFGRSAVGLSRVGGR